MYLSFQRLLAYDKEKNDMVLNEIKFLVSCIIFDKKLLLFCQQGWNYDKFWFSINQFNLMNPKYNVTWLDKTLLYQVILGGNLKEEIQCSYI